MTNKERKAKVYHADLWGLREKKYAWLSEHGCETTGWQEIQPRTEFYLFVPQDTEVLERYNQFVKVTDIFPVNSVGIVTSRDRFVFDFDREVLKRRIRTFLDPNLPEDVVRETFKLRDSHAWSLKKARQAIGQDKNWEDKIVRCLYRPFDVRWLFYHSAVIERGREEVMRHMLAGENLALLVSRQVVSDFRHALVAEDVTNFNNIDVAGRFGSGYQFPLYLYPVTDWRDLLTHETAERRPNLNPVVVSALAHAYGQKPFPEEIFHYIYAVLYAPTYREKNAQFLKIDFPKIPFTVDFELFKALSALGKQLVDVHLLRSSELDPPIVRFQGKGDDILRTGKKNLRYDLDTQRVYINPGQYFEGVSPQVWEYRIGGYQVCHKWLKDRKDRLLSLDEIRTYCHIVTALARTIDIQSSIDELYPNVEEKLFPIELTDV
ncbi:MAG: type ISP restriction/modification enzyme [Candidatus Bipolaricaulota bacterium]|nr:type ISP restriction/modification enzyme [Candidatus Bipolaricaulota bacterium]